MECIFCATENQSRSIEHIVPESFGNQLYVAQKSAICETCNGSFSKFENIALTKSIFAMERARLGIKTKKGHNVKGDIGYLGIEGDADFRKSIVNVKGLKVGDLKEVNAETQTFQLLVSAFDGSEVATSKLLLKIGLEAIFTSRQEIYKKYDFQQLRGFLRNEENTDWPFMTTDSEPCVFSSIPSKFIKHYLTNRKCILRIGEYKKDCLLFKFKFGAVAMTINLLNRNLDWIVSCVDQYREEIEYVNPSHYRKKVFKNLR